jgi:L-arabinonolactonase
VCFGGPELDVLCITTARIGLSEASLSTEPNAGDVFLYRVGVKGLPEAEYQP